MSLQRRPRGPTVLLVFLILIGLNALPAPVPAEGGDDGRSETADTPPPFFYRVTNGETVAVLEALVDGRTAVDFYGYSSGDSSSHTGYEAAQTASIFLWSGPEGKGLVFMLDQKNDPDGGTLRVSIAGAPANASWSVKDDPGDGYTATSADWLWIRCCTDGGVYDLASNDAVTLNLTFSGITGLDVFRLFGGPAADPQYVLFDPTKPLLIETFQTPGAPGLEATAGPEPGEVTLEASPPEDDGGDPVTAYRFYEEVNHGVWSFIGEAANGILAVDGLPDGATHSFIARAVNRGGEGDGSAAATVTTFDVPGAPAELVATASTTLVGTVELTWSAPTDDGGTPLIGYRVYRDGSFVAENTDGGIVEDGLANDTTYSYTVSALNAVGEGPVTASVPVTTPTVPSAPAALVVTPGEDIGTTHLTWDPPISDGRSPILGYIVYAGNSPEELGPVATVTTTEYVHHSSPPVPLPEARHYAVAAMNAIGTGPAGDTGCGVYAPYGPLSDLLCG